MDCDKVKYVSQGQATKAAKRIGKILGGRRQREYFCPSCKCWHLTTQKKPNFKKVNK